MIPHLRRKLCWTIPLDISYLAAFVMVPMHPWLSYWLLLGLVCTGVGAMAWATRGRNHAAAPFLILASPFLPFSVARLARSECLSGSGSAAPTPALSAATLPGVGAMRPPALRVAILGMLVILLTGTATGFLDARVANPALAPAEAASDAYLHRTMALAAASYGTARAVDRTIAVAAETQMGPVLATFKPGQFFKPIQDMAVRYSDVMVLVMASVGAQLILTEIGRAGAVPVLGSAFILVLMMAQVLPRAMRWRLAGLARLLLVLLIGLRLVVPAMAGLAALVGDAVLDDRRHAAQAAIDTMAAPALERPGEVTLETSYWRQIVDTAEGAIGAVTAFSDSMVEQFVQLLVVYSLEALVLPLLTILVFWRLARLCLAPAPAEIGAAMAETRRPGPG